jgi:hypothetical protein
MSRIVLRAARSAPSNRAPQLERSAESENQTETQTNMEIKAPVWNLEKPRCECCSGQGALCFYSCPSCGHVALICDEVGTVFLDPKNLEHAVYGGTDDPNCICPSCHQVAAHKFRPTTGDEIQMQGYKIEEYE